jgi:hypothetical protein
VLVDSRGEIAQQRKELAAHADTEKAWIAVGRVDRERDSVTCDVRVDRRPRGAQEGTNEVVRARREDGEAAWARASKEAEEDGLCPILAVVCGRDDNAVHFFGSRPERFVASRTRAGLEVSAGSDPKGRPCKRDL